MPVQVYTSSPISADPPKGVTPKTAGPQDGQDGQEGHTVSPLTATPISSASQHGTHPAQPGARPHLPAQTDAPQTPGQSRYQPTQTQPDSSSSPPPPQPGAVPSPVVGRSVPHPPPPPPPQPKAGEAAPSSSSSSSSSYQAPHASQFAYGARQSYTQANDGEKTNYSHPPGYQQDAYAAEFSSAQLAAQNRSTQGATSSSTSFGEEDSVWDMAKKWATAAGNTLAAAENEIWKRINGD